MIRSLETFIDDTTIEIPQPSWIREPPEPDDWDDDEPVDLHVGPYDWADELVIVHGDTVAEWDAVTEAFVVHQGEVIQRNDNC